MHFISLTYPVILQATSAILRPFENEFGPFQKQLLAISSVVRDEVSLASKKAQDQEIRLQTRERQLARMHRVLERTFQGEVMQEQLRARLQAARELTRIAQRFDSWLTGDVGNARLRVLDWLSVYDFQKSWKYFRRQCLQRTSSWIFQKPEWGYWLSCTSSAKMCCTGSCKSIIRPIYRASDSFY